MVDLLGIIVFRVGGTIWLYGIIYAYLRGAHIEPDLLGAIASPSRGVDIALAMRRPLVEQIDQLQQ